MHSYERQKPSKILIFSECSEALLFFKESLSSLKTSLLEATSEKEAIGLAESKLPALLILDLKLPAKKTADVCSRLKKVPYLQNIPFLLLSSECALILEAIPHEYIDYISHPVNPKLFAKKVEQYIRFTAEKALLRAENTELSRRSKDLENFSSIAAHDLKTPLSIIQGYSDILLSQDDLDGDNRTFLEKVQESSLSMSSFIEDLLSYSRLNSESLEHQSVSVTQLLDDSFDKVAQLVSTTKAKITIESTFPGIHADPFLLTQLFTHLLTNSLTFIESGSTPQVIIRSKVMIDRRVPITTQKLPSICIISFHDSGIGFPPEQREHIFEAFTRLHPRSTYPGAGLGLAACRKIAGIHQGTITATSTPGEGATFFLTLPLNESEATP